MLWAISSVILFVVFAWKDIYKYSDEFLEYAFFTFFLTFFAAIAFAVGLAIASLIGCAIRKKWHDSETAELVSLRDGNGMSGHFFLGTGSIGAQQYYFFYKKIGEGYQPGKVEVANNVMVYEQERQSGQMKTYIRDFSNPAWNLLAICWTTERYEFIIQSGSLKKNFVLQ